MFNQSRSVSNFKANRGGYNNRTPKKRGFSSNNIPEYHFVSKAKKSDIKSSYILKHQFNDFQLSDDLKSRILKHGYTTPTPIQDQVIPLVLSGSDVVGIAQTGTGKTGAFLIPLIQKNIENRQNRVLIITPTRELALQIREELMILTVGLGIYSTLCIGGASIRMQDLQLRKRPQFVIATPGRIKDLSERRIITLSDFGTVVLDEVDRMLDMGFIHDIRKIVSQLPVRRQSLFFSATFSNKIASLASGFLTDPKKVMISSQKPSDNVDQDIVRVVGIEAKLNELDKIISYPEVTKTLVFVNSKRIVENIARRLKDNGHLVVTLHGDKPQNSRFNSISAFRENRANVLVATDVASRGLDIDGISHVINFDRPYSIEDYIHRIGRTGRAGKKGVALTFV